MKILIKESGIDMLGIDQFLTKTPGCGGKIREKPEDFLVEEILPYQFSGKGEHAILKIQKISISTLEARKRIAKAFDTPPKDIGYAGLKDTHAVAVQHFSIPKKIDTLPEIQNIKILGTFQHSRKIKIGKLYANTFKIRIRNCDPEKGIETFKILQNTGVPNVFGWQRFGGRNGKTHLFGEAIVKKQKVQLPSRDKGTIWLYVSAYQSFLYNRILNERLKIGVKKLDGDLMKHYHGLECPSALFPGQKTPLASGTQGEIEKNILEENNVSCGDIPSLGKRRAIAFPLLESNCKKELSDLILKFTIPKGCFATAVLREVMKEDVG